MERTLYVERPPGFKQKIAGALSQPIRPPGTRGRRSRDDLGGHRAACGCLPSIAAYAKALDATRHAVGGAPTGIGQPPTVRPQGYARQGCARALAAKRSHLSLGCLRRASCRTRPGRCQFCPRDWVVPKLPPAHAPTRGWASDAARRVSTGTVAILSSHAAGAGSVASPQSSILADQDWRRPIKPSQFIHRGAEMIRAFVRRSE